MVRVSAEGLGHDLLKLRFDIIDRLSRRETCAIANPKNVGVDCESFFAERGVEKDIGRLSSNAGERFKLVTHAWDFASMPIDQRMAKSDDVLRLGVEQADGLDRFAQTVLAKSDHLPGRRDKLEQRFGRAVHAGIGGLRRQHDSDQQRIWIDIIQFGRRGRVRLRQATEELEDLVARHSRSSSAAERRVRASSNSPVGRPNPTRKWSGISNQRPGTIEAS